MVDELVSHRPTAAEWQSWGSPADSTGPHSTAAAPAARTLLVLHAPLPLNTHRDRPLHLRPGRRGPGRPHSVPGVHGWGRRCWDPPGSPRPGTLSWSVQPVKGGQLIFISGKSRCLQQETVLFLLFQFV